MHLEIRNSRMFAWICDIRNRAFCVQISLCMHTKFICGDCQSLAVRHFENRHFLSRLQIQNHYYRCAVCKITTKDVWCIRTYVIECWYYGCGAPDHKHCDREQEWLWLWQGILVTDDGDLQPLFTLTRNHCECDRESSCCGRDWLSIVTVTRIHSDGDRESWWPWSTITCDSHEKSLWLWPGIIVTAARYLYDLWSTVTVSQIHCERDQHHCDLDTDCV